MDAIAELTHRLQLMHGSSRPGLKVNASLRRVTLAAGKRDLYFDEIVAGNERHNAIEGAVCEQTDGPAKSEAGPIDNRGAETRDQTEAIRGREVLQIVRSERVVRELSRLYQG